MLLKACIILVNVSMLKTQSTTPSLCMGDVCYVRVESSSGRDWTEAQQACLSYYRSTLPIVDDSKHQISFEAAVRCLTAEEERNSGIWIGAKASYSNPKNWTWLAGSNYLDTSVESQKGYGMTYAFVQNTSTGMRVHASYPTENHSYICHYPTQADIMCTNGTGITVENQCFVKFDEPMSWFSARNACLSNAGDLASFSNISLLEGRIGSDGVWVGLRSSQWNWQRAGIAVITDSSSDVTFTLWNSGEPNDATPSCISTDAGDKFPNWRDCDCSLSLPFICQSPLLVQNSESSNCLKPSTTSRHTLSSSLRSWTTKSISATTVASNGDEQQTDENDIGSVNTALAVGLGVGIGVPVILALVIIVIVISVRRKRRNSNAGENPKSRETAKREKSSKKTQENNRMEMSETQNGQPHYDNFSAASQYATIPASPAAAGPRLDAPSTQGTVYADLSFNQAGSS